MLNFLDIESSVKAGQNELPIFKNFTECNALYAFSKSANHMNMKEVSINYVRH